MTKKTLLFGVLLCLVFFIPQSVQAAWTVDLNPPTCSIGFSPTSPQLAGKLITTFFSVTDPNNATLPSATLQKDGTYVNANQYSPGYYSYSWTNTGTHVFKVNTFDAAGNLGSCQATFQTISSALNGGWSLWGSCRDISTGELISCGIGRETRYCNTPAPENGGAECIRDATDNTLTTPTNRSENRTCILNCSGVTPTSYSISGTMYISATSTPYTGGFTVGSTEGGTISQGDSSGQYIVTNLPTLPSSGTDYQFTFSVPAGYRVTNAVLSGWSCGGTWPQYTPCPGPTLYGSISRLAFSSSPNLTGVNIFLQEISSVITPWIQVTGDVHSNTRINAGGGP